MEAITIAILGSFLLATVASIAAMYTMAVGKGEQKARHAFDLGVVAFLFIFTGLLIMLPAETLQLALFFALPVAAFVAYLAGMCRNSL